MYDFLIAYDSLATKEEERIIELSLIEAAHLFPNLNLVMMQPGSVGYLPLADMAIENARVNEKGAINAVDVLKTVSKVEDSYTILFLTKELYVNMAEIGRPDQMIGEVTDISSDNAFVYNIASLRPLGLEDQMFMVEHTICRAIGKMVFGLEQGCSEPNCMLHQTHSDREMIRLVRDEGHDEQRLCKKCRDKLLNSISVSARLTPSRLDIY